MPAIYLFGKRSLLGGDDLHFPALGAATVRFIQMICLVLPLQIYILKQALNFVDDETPDGKDQWPLWNYLFHWWDEADAAASAKIDGYDGPPSCVESFFARYYPFLSFLHLCCTVLFCLHSLTLEYRIWYWSCQGTPTKRQPRTKNVQELMEKKIGICTMLLALIVGSTYYFANFCFAKPYHRCVNSILLEQGADNIDGDGDDNDQSIVRIWVGSPSWYVLGALLALSQTAEIVLAALFYLQLKKSETDASSREAGTQEIAARSSLYSAHHELMEELWADRCQALFRCLSFSTCFLFGGRDLAKNDQRNDSYRHVAQALADYFETQGTLDVVPTDMFTGLLVLQRIQRLRRLRHRRKVHKESNSLRVESVRSSLRMDNTRSNSGYGTRNQNHAPATEPIDNSYHQMISPSGKTGLRSRVASSNDLRNRPVGNSTVLPSPKSAPLNSDDVLSNVHVAPQSAFPDTKGTPNRQGASTPEPTSQHLQQAEGLRRRDIFRRKEPNSAINITNHSEHSFYRITARHVLNPLDPVEAAYFEEGARMCKYALSIYTWMLYVFDHPVTGIPRLACPTSKCFRKCCSDLCGLKERNSHGADSIGSQNSQASASMPLFSTNNCNAERFNESTVETLTIEQTLTSEGIETFPPSSPSGLSSENRGRITNEIGIGCPSGNEFVCGSTSGDTFCGWHKKALLMVADIPEADLVYAEFNSKLRSVPYCILLDHEHSLVVVSIRGSLSLEDIVTDSLLLPQSLEEIGNKYGFDGRDQYSHSGIVACFENVMKDLERHNWLQRLLGQQFPDYSLRFVGHSLGAGVCALMGYALRPKYPSLKVFAYSPPGCTMTWDMAIGCKGFVTTFVLDSDMVPRLSVSCMEELRDEVLELVGRLKVSKHQVFQKFLRRRNTRRNSSWLYTGGNGNISGGSQIGISEDDEDELEELTEIISEILDDVPSDTLYHRQLQEFRQVQHERRASRGETSLRELYPPGTMIHLIKTGQEEGYSHTIKRCLTCKTSNSGSFYTPIFISNDDLDEIVVASTMGSDHFIDRMCHELHTLSKKYCLEAPGMDGVANAYPCGLGA